MKRKKKNISSKITSAVPKNYSYVYKYYISRYTTRIELKVLLFAILLFRVGDIISITRRIGEPETKYSRCDESGQNCEKTSMSSSR
ncbi:unnamed protein product [Parnassius apollo]|uniref:(apollo) hypothetical protein n=1 Tax=Parnassius apollo TaxID=110799 RepID=A0A8S3X7D5_PARAO|nr:unnamed protein product [Parnassius apollo]